MSKKSNAVRKDQEVVAAEQVATPETAEQQELRFAAARKYANRVEKAGKADSDPLWAKKEFRFTLGFAPKSEKSVFGILYALAGANPEYTGAQLAARLRWYEFPNRKRSEYLDGVPPVGWAEGYIDGAVSKGYLRIAKPE